MADGQKQSADPLPYVIVFAILFFIVLGLLTWVLDQWFKERQCTLFPNIWCSDNWTCNNSCPPGFPGNQCFVNPGPTGLASCIFGPHAPGATTCLVAPSQTGGVACNCPTGMAEQTANCFSGCAQNFSSINPATICCCAPNTPGCPWTSINPPPAQCLGTH